MSIDSQATVARVAYTDAHARHPTKFFISATTINLKMKILRVTRLTGIPLSPAWLWPRKTQRARETIMVASG